ncbi:10127_t:CDS:2, partial [Racocetra fulgida]
FQLDRSLIFTIRYEKNNQNELKDHNKYEKFSSQCIYISANLLNNENKPVQDLQNYINLCPLDAYESQVQTQDKSQVLILYESQIPIQRNSQILMQFKNTK